MRNNELNQQVIQRVAKALGPLNQRVVFVGGAVTSLYVDDPAADDHRMTHDVDLSIEIASTNALNQLRVQLNELGFSQNTQDRVPCRFRLGSIVVDVMATEPIGWAPANRWYAAGFPHAQALRLGDCTIQLLPLPYYLATKFDAFHDRGIDDLWFSKDLQDIAYLLDFCTTLFDALRATEAPVQRYLLQSLKGIQRNENIQDAILGNLRYNEQSARMRAIMQDIDAFVQDLE